MNKKIKTVIFDAGGILYDWKPVWRQCASDLGVDPEKFLEISIALAPSAELGEMFMDELFQQVARQAGIADQWKTMYEYIPKRMRRIKQTFRLLEEIKGKYRLAILTNNLPNFMDLWEKITHYQQYFDRIFDSSVEKLRKPDERFFLLAAERLNLKTEECLYVEDDDLYISVAQKLGFKTVHFTDPETGVKLIRKILYGKI